MTYNLYISGSDYSGKTSMILGLSMLLQEEGVAVGYFKPVGNINIEDTTGMCDEDVKIMSNILHLKYPPDITCPILLRSDYVTQLESTNKNKLTKRILECYEIVKKDNEIVIIEASNRPETLNYLDLSAPDIARTIGASILLVVNASSEQIIDVIWQYRDYFRQEGCKTIGSILNLVPPRLTSTMKNLIAPKLEKAGMKSYGIIPRQKELGVPTVRDVISALGAEVLVEGNLEDKIENMLIGAMTPETALRYFRRSRGHAVITGGDRPAVAAAALETDTKVLIFTGNLSPEVRILETARSKNISVLLVPYDTYTTTLHVENLIGRIKPTDKKAIESVKETMAKYVQWKTLIKDLKSSSQ